MVCCVVGGVCVGLLWRFWLVVVGGVRFGVVGEFVVLGDGLVSSLSTVNIVKHRFVSLSSFRFASNFVGS